MRAGGKAQACPAAEGLLGSTAVERIAEKLMETKPAIALLLLATALMITHGHHWVKLVLEMRKTQSQNPKNTTPSRSAPATVQEASQGAVRNARPMWRRMVGMWQFWLALLDILIALSMFAGLAWLMRVPKPPTVGDVAMCAACAAFLVISAQRRW